jgi:hypothetical protein
MSPRPHLMQQGSVLAATLVVLSVVGYPGTALALAGLIVLSAAIFLWRYRSFREAIPDHRRDRDRLVLSLVVVCAFAPGVLALVLLRVGSPFEIAPPGGIWFVSVTLVAGVVFTSSLADWYWILPRLSGLGSWPRPCQVEVPKDEHNWRFLTQFWYGHRLLAEFVGVATFPATAEYIAATDDHHRALWQTLAAVFAIGASVFIASWLKAWGNVQSPPVTVGSLIGVARISWHPLTRLLYAVDVDLRGVQCMLVDEARHHLDGELDPKTAFATKKETTSIKSDEPVDPKRDYEPPCRHHCTGINWYCSNNPRAYDPN